MLNHSRPPASVADVLIIGESENESDSDDDLEGEITLLLLSSGKEKLANRDTKAAERLFRNCLSRLKTVGLSNAKSRQLATASPPELEVMQHLYELYYSQERWSEAQAMWTKIMSLKERLLGKHDVTTAADVLTLAKLTQLKGSSTEALLHARRALKIYRKAKDSENVVLCLEVLVEVCSDMEDEREAYATMLEGIMLRQKSPHTKDSETLHREADSLSSLGISLGANSPRANTTLEEKSRISLDVINRAVSSVRGEAAASQTSLTEDFSHNQSPQEEEPERREEATDSADPTVASLDTDPAGGEALTPGTSVDMVVDALLASHPVTPGSSSKRLDGSADCNVVSLPSAETLSPTRTLSEPRVGAASRSSSVERAVLSQTPGRRSSGASARSYDTADDKGYLRPITDADVATTSMAASQSPHSMGAGPDEAPLWTDPQLASISTKNEACAIQSGYDKESSYDEPVQVSHPNRERPGSWDKDAPTDWTPVVVVSAHRSLSAPSLDLPHRDELPSASSTGFLPSLSAETLAGDSRHVVGAASSPRPVRHLHLPPAPVRQLLSLPVHPLKQSQRQQDSGSQHECQTEELPVAEAGMKVSITRTSSDRSRNDGSCVSRQSQSNDSTSSGPSIGTAISSSYSTPNLTLPTLSTADLGLLDPRLTPSVHPLKQRIREREAEERLLSRLPTPSIPESPNAQEEAWSVIADAGSDGDGETLPKAVATATRAAGGPGGRLKVVGGAEIRRKLVLVGDGACGKTFLQIRFSKGRYPDTIIVSPFDNFVADVEVDGKHVELALWDTAGQEDYDRLRPLSYPDAHAVLICFSIANPDSLDNVLEKVSFLLYVHSQSETDKLVVDLGSATL